jgi:hypothetical protein
MMSAMVSENWKTTSDFLNITEGFFFAVTEDANLTNEVDLIRNKKIGKLPTIRVPINIRRIHSHELFINGKTSAFNILPVALAIKEKEARMIR